MIRIDNKNKPNIVKFPKNLSDFTPNCVKLRSEVTAREYTFSGKPDTAGYADYYCPILELADVPDGEWIYTITDGEIENTGLLHIGKLEATEKVEYKANNVNIQYQTEF